ncbi:MAG: 6,7-dimethyl-8-ribityllumazine synthase [Planctomycetota bacterium]|jgi:6,7-dimethyl-8-ribityllumazine synthase
MASTIQGSYEGAGLKFGIVVSRFNEFVGEKLREGALDCLARHGVSEDDVTIVLVPGSFELPLVAKRMAASGSYDAVLCLGALIRGQTPHFDYIAAEATKGVAQASLDTGVPVLFGIVTADTLEQAIDRAGAKAGNKGYDAALAGLEMANLLKALP